MSAATRAELERLLEEDAPHGDLTTELLGIGSADAVMRFTARDPMVLALAEDAAALIEIAGGQVELFHPSGARLAKGQPVLEAVGRAGALMRSWKVAQTLIETWSGVASEARATQMSIFDAWDSLTPPSLTSFRIRARDAKFRSGHAPGAKVRLSACALSLVDVARRSAHHANDLAL